MSTKTHLRCLQRALVLASVCLAPVVADAADAYYAFEESFALSQIAERGSHPITTFVPRLYLLYIENRDETQTVVERDYLKATTQDGVKVLVLESTVSKRPFRESVGNHQVIFNAEYDLCKQQGCLRTDSDMNWHIRRGESFEIIQGLANDGVISLRGTRQDNVLVAYVSQAELDDISRRGIITRADRRHPKYEIERTELTRLGTKCGQVRNVGSEVAASQDSAIRKLESLAVSSLNLGSLSEANNLPRIHFTDKIGDVDREVQFAVYTAKQGEESRRFATAIIYECKTTGVAARPVRILSVDILDVETQRRYPLQLGRFPSADQLIDLINTPYLFSVNGYEQYSNLMDRLGNIFEDRSLAGYFLSEFNRSCRSRDRNSDLCKGHDYRD